MSFKSNTARQRKTRKSSKGPQLVQNVLGSALKQYGLDEQIARYTFVNEWSKIVGQEIASRSRPESIAHGTLTVRVVDSAWAQELSFHKSVLLSRLKKFLSDDEQVNDIRFYVDGSGKGL